MLLAIYLSVRRLENISGLGRPPYPSEYSGFETKAPIDNRQVIIKGRKVDENVSSQKKYEEEKCNIYSCIRIIIRIKVGPCPYTIQIVL